MKKFIFLSLLFLVILLTSLAFNAEKKTPSKPNYQPGIVLTFDDDYVDEWETAHNILKKYDYKATFCVTKIHKMDETKINKLQELQAYGNEIAGHGLNHLNALNTVKEIGFKHYFDAEIVPMLIFMKSHNLHISSFSYPDGAKSDAIDLRLLKTFKVVRGTLYRSYPPSMENCYYKHSNVVYALGIDDNYPQFSIPYFIELLKYAKANNKILVLYAHKPVYKPTAKYETEMATLIKICQYVHQNNMKFYTLSELYNLE